MFASVTVLCPAGLPAVFFFAALIAGAGLLWWTTLAERDLWPFSHYPMFGSALEATAVRFFRLKIHLADGSAVKLKGAADPLVDSLHRKFEPLWRNGPVVPAAADEVVLRCWREACRLDRRLAPAQRIEVVMRCAQLIRGGEIAVMEKTVHVVVIGRGSVVA